MVVGRRKAKSAKERRRISMMQIAADLFRTNGYEATRMEDIAAVADVVPATVYNHFKTKGDLLLAIGAEVAAETDVRAREFFQNLVEHPLFAATAYVMLLTRDSLEQLDHVTWRHHLGLTTSGLDASLIQATQLFQNSIQLSLERLIVAGQERGELPLSWDVRHRAELCYRIYRSRFAELVAGDDVDFEEFERRIMRDYMILLSPAPGEQ